MNRNFAVFAVWQTLAELLQHVRRAGLVRYLDLSAVPTVASSEMLIHSAQLGTNEMRALLSRNDKFKPHLPTWGGRALSGQKFSAAAAGRRSPILELLHPRIPRRAKIPTRKRRRTFIVTRRIYGTLCVKNFGVTALRNTKGLRGHKLNGKKMSRIPRNTPLAGAILSHLCRIY